ncbi:19714_t:CDS:1, partial [Gigaspora margarita]
MPILWQFKFHTKTGLLHGVYETTGRYHTYMFWMRKKLQENNYGELQYLVREFCEQIKFQFTGDDPNFHYEIDLE